MINNNELIDQIKSYNRFLNSESLNKAYNFALEAHHNQKREEGVPYIIHPVAVAKILTELKLDSATITTGLLHDTIEDTNVTYETVKKEFGEEVANLVEGVTKISALEDKASSVSKAENFRKLILATSKDIRVLLVKLADRLHNMRTIQFVKDEEKIIRKAKETMEIYAPLADRMGMNRIRDELEDLSFSVLNKPARDLILERLNFIKNNKEDTFKSISQELISLLKENGITATIVGREKTPFSIWRKMQNKKVSLEQLSDIIGFRVIVKSIEDCYKTLGIFHSKFSTIPGKFKDYISTPKINNYKSIHTAVIGPRKNRIEIQIRTNEMNEFAQRGIASHWKYKSSEKFSELSWKEYDWLRDLVEIIEAGTSPEHYYEFTKLQMFQENVFCFTPKGAVIKLPRQASPVDFAYAVHTKIGNSAIGCNINGTPATLQSLLKNGKARSAIRRYWQDKSTENSSGTEKNYSSTIEVDLPHKPGALGHISSLIGINKGNIINIEMLKRKSDYLTFSFDLQIKDLKNFTNLISQIKQSDLKFKIIRHKQRKNAFIRRIFENFKRN